MVSKKVQEIPEACENHAKACTCYGISGGLNNVSERLQIFTEARDSIFNGGSRQCHISLESVGDSPVICALFKDPDSEKAKKMAEKYSSFLESHQIYPMCSGERKTYVQFRGQKKSKLPSLRELQPGGTCSDR